MTGKGSRFVPYYFLAVATASNGQHWRGIERCRTGAKMDRPDERTVDVVIELPFYLLQTLRLAQAIGEAGFRICVEPDDRKAVVRLKKVFGLDFKVGTAGIQRISGLYLDHLKPVTRVGSIERQLMMPASVFRYCRARWPQERAFNVSFAGLLTDTRRAAINEWLIRSGLEQIELPPDPSFLGKQLRRVALKLGVPIENHVGTKDVRIYVSDRGRHFPLKAWNTAYYDLMLSSKFVLCPSGDFKENGVVWTYRFFEGVLCGTIPVVEEPCAAYEGYRYRLMSEPLTSLQWSREDAEHNFALAREQTVVDRDELRAQVLGLLRAPDTELEGKVKDTVGRVFAT